MSKVIRQKSPIDSRGRLTGLALLFALVLAPAQGWSADMYVKSSVNLPASISAFEISQDLDGDGLNDALAVYQRRIMVFF